MLCETWLVPISWPRSGSPGHPDGAVRGLGAVALARLSVGRPLLHRLPRFVAAAHRKHLGVREHGVGGEGEVANGHAEAKALRLVDRVLHDAQLARVPTLLESPRPGASGELREVAVFLCEPRRDAPCAEARRISLERVVELVDVLPCPGRFRAARSGTLAVAAILAVAALGELIGPLLRGRRAVKADSRGRLGRGLPELVYHVGGCDPALLTL